jgi:tubulin-specific chaperone A
MGPPSQLSIATSSLNRLVKDEKSYHREAEHQESRIAKLEQGGSNDENAEYTLRQEVWLKMSVNLFDLYI